jgi:hypothetical protein
MLEQLSDDIHQARQRIDELDDLDGYLQHIKSDATIKLADAEEVLRDLAVILERLDLDLEHDDDVTLESIQDDLQSSWFELLGQRYALQDRAKGRPTCHPAWTGVRCTTWACNRLNDVIADLSCAQRALDSGQRIKENNR